MRAQIFNRNLLLILVILCGVLFFSPAYAEESPSSTEDIVEETSTTTEDIAEDEGTTPTTTEEIIEELIYTNQVSVNYIGEEIFNGEVITTSTWFLDSNDTLYSNTSTITALGVLMQASRQENFSVNVENLGWGYYVSSVDENASEGYDGWIYNVNNTDPGWAGINDYTMNDGDSLQVFYNVWPWKIGSDVTSTYENKPVTFTAYKYADSTWGPSPSTTISVNNELFETDNTGQYIYTTSTTGTLQAYIYGSADWPTNSPSISVEILEAATTTATSTDDNTDDGDDSGSSGSTPPTMTNESISQDELNAATEKILNYLKSQQDETGKILDGNMTDWAIMSFGADEQYADDIKQTDGESLLEYEKSYSLDADSDLNDCASFPRHVLALLAAGVSTEDDAMTILKDRMTAENCYTNNLYGANGINDDVFALLALLALDVDPTENIITDIVSTTLSWQMDDGAFSWPDWADPTQKSAGDDITGASISALQYAKNKGVSIDENILTSATDYLKTTQETDGGWTWDSFSTSSDIMTTSWVLMGINALGETQDDWFTSTGKNPWHPLLENLNDEGFYESAWVPGDVDWFAMKHAVPALKNTSWPIVLDPIVEDFSEGATFTYGGGGSSYVPPIVETPTSTPTTTINTETPTSTPTSTIDIIEITTSTPTSTPKTKIEVSTSTKDLEATTTKTQTTQTIIHPETKPSTPVIKKLPANEYRLPEIEASTSTPEEFVGQVLTSGTSTIPTSNTAKGVFGTAATMASELGLYLGWRFLQTLV